MGRHIDAAGTSRHLRRTAQLSGLAGGIAWVVAAFLEGGSAAILLWLGGALVTVALFGLGMLLVKSDVLLLRIFVALALPTLVWAVVALLRDSSVSTTLVDVAFGGSVALVTQGPTPCDGIAEVKLGGDVVEELGALVAAL